MQSVADRIAEIRRTRKRPEQAIANWIARERRRGNAWLADSIAEQAGLVAPSIVPKQSDLRGTVQTVKPSPGYTPEMRKPWWTND